MYDRSAAELCHRMHGVYEPEVNECLVDSSRIPVDDPEFGYLNNCKYCGERNNELHVVFMGRPASVDNIEVVCERHIDEPRKSAFKLDDFINNLMGREK